MWKFKYAWPVYISLILFVSIWIGGMIQIQQTLEGQIENLWIVSLIGFLLLIWHPFVYVFYLQKNRMKNGLFGGFIAFLILSIGFLIWIVIISIEIQSTGVVPSYLFSLFVLFIVVFNALLLVRHLNKTTRTVTEWIKWGGSHLVFGGMPFFWVYVVFKQKGTSLLATDFAKITFLMVWNILFFAIFFLNLYDLHRRDKQKQAADYEQLVSEMGTEDLGGFSE